MRVEQYTYVDEGKYFVHWNVCRPGVAHESCSSHLRPPRFPVVRVSGYSYPSGPIVLGVLS